MPSRISGACNGCRSKKQKCSGDRTGCIQCEAAGIECTWPEQRKRGPAKGYIEALETRLYAAESLLLAILPRLEDAALNEATSSQMRRSSRAGSESSGVGSEEQRINRSSPPLLNKKTGIEYWENFPLDSAAHVRRWQQDCESQSQSHSGMRVSSSLHLHPPPPSGRHRDDDYRSSAAAAAAIAGMRHASNTPGTPNTGQMVAGVVSRSLSYESALSPGPAMNVGSDMVATSSPHRQQQAMWYPQYGHMATPVMSQSSMAMNPNMNYNEHWVTPQPSGAMDVDTIHTLTTAQQARQGPRHSQEAGLEQAHENARAAMFQGDYSQDIFW